MLRVRITAGTTNPSRDEQVNQYSWTHHYYSPTGSGTLGWWDYAYDANGNMTAKDFWNNSRTVKLEDVDLKYDYRNQLVEFKRQSPGGTLVHKEFRYDAFGRRISEYDLLGSTGKRFVYDGWRVVEERNASNAVAASFVYGSYIDEVLSMRRGTANYYIHHDDQWNVIAITDMAGTVLERIRYDDWGKPTYINPITGTEHDRSQIGNPFAFTGREWDADTGLYYYRHRYFDPELGRFITRDPIGMWGDWLNLGNGQTYTGNNPWSWVDPFGLDAENPWHHVLPKACMADMGYLDEIADWLHDSINGVNIAADLHDKTLHSDSEARIRNHIAKLEELNQGPATSEQLKDLARAERDRLKNQFGDKITDATQKWPNRKKKKDDELRRKNIEGKQRRSLRIDEMRKRTAGDVAEAVTDAAGRKARKKASKKLLGRLLVGASLALEAGDILESYESGGITNAGNELTGINLLGDFYGAVDTILTSWGTEKVAPVCER